MGASQDDPDFLIVQRAIARASTEHDRGFQRGLIAAGEPWVALFFGIAGGLVGFVIGAAVYAR